MQDLRVTDQLARRENARRESARPEIAGPENSGPNSAAEDMVFHILFERQHHDLFYCEYCTHFLLHCVRV